MTTVGELIAKLSEFPPDLLVVVDGYEGGLTEPDLTTVSVVTIRLNVNTSRWQGEHEEVMGDDVEPGGRAEAVRIQR